MWTAGDTFVPLPGVSPDHPACLILAQDPDQEEGWSVGAAVEHRGVTEEGSARSDGDRAGSNGGGQTQWLALACMYKLLRRSGVQDAAYLLELIRTLVVSLGVRPRTLTLPVLLSAVRAYSVLSELKGEDHSLPLSLHVPKFQPWPWLFLRRSCCAPSTCPRLDRAGSGRCRSGCSSERRSSRHYPPRRSCRQSTRSEEHNV